MSLIRRNPRRDGNERDLVYALRKFGCFVTRLSEEGVPDLLVGYRGDWYLVEVKDKGGTLTEKQKDFHKEALHYRCKVYYLRHREDIPEMLRAWSPLEAVT